MKKSAERASAPAAARGWSPSSPATLWKATERRRSSSTRSATAPARSSMRSSCRCSSRRSRPACRRSTCAALHFLAPAITTDLFKERLKELIGPGQPITQLTTYTMADELEQADSSLKPYGKSLLYLVSGCVRGRRADADPRACRSSLQAGPAADPLLRPGRHARRSPTSCSRRPPPRRAAERPHRSRSRTAASTTTCATMTSVIRRVLDAPDTAAVIDYFEEVVAGFDPAPPSGWRAAAPRRRPRAARARPCACAGGACRPPPRKPWTVMVWMAGDNDLESFGDQDLAEMKRVGSTDDVNVVVQFDSMQRRSHAPLPRQAERRCSTPTSSQELGETNTGDPAGRRSTSSAGRSSNILPSACSA